MQLPVYDTFPPGERERATDLQELLAGDALAYFGPVDGLVPARTFHNIAEIIAHAAPWAAAERLAPAVRFCMWMYLLDYHVDETPGTSPEQLEAVHAPLEVILRGGPAPSEKEAFLQHGLADIVGELEANAASPALVAAFKEEVLKEFEADRVLSALAHSARTTGRLPNVETFLDWARVGVNHMSCSVSLGLALDDALGEEDVTRLWPALEDAATAIRLANDRRTHPKDEAEGLLSIRSYGWPEQEVRERIAAHLGQCDQQLEAFAADTGFPATAEALRRITHIGVEMYDVTDIRYEM